MTEIRGRILSSNQTISVVAIERSALASGCCHCSSPCGVSSTLEIPTSNTTLLTLPQFAGGVGKNVELHLSNRNLLRVLLSTLLLPLAGFCIGALTGQWFGLTELDGVGLSLVGMVVGVVLGRRIPAPQLKYKEV